MLTLHCLSCGIDANETDLHAGGRAYLNALPAGVAH